MLRSQILRLSIGIPRDDGRVHSDRADAVGIGTPRALSSDAEVADFEAPHFVYQKVARLDVAMHDPVFVQVCEA